MSRRAPWAAAKEIEIHLEEIDSTSTLIEIRVDPDIRGSYTSGAAVAALVLGGRWAFGFAVLASSWFSLPTLGLVAIGGVTATAIGAVAARITGHYSPAVPEKPFSRNWRACWIGWSKRKA